MSRTADHLVECHRLAAERRRAGKPEWERTIDVASILAEVHETYGEDGPDDAALHAAARRIAALVRASVPAGWLDFASPEYDRELDEFVEEFDDICVGDAGDGYTLRKHFGGWLDQFYDWADYKRVWTGGLGAPKAKTEPEEPEAPSRGPGM